MIKKFILLLVVSIVLAASGVACKHTANGAGKDIQKAGQEIQKKTK